MLINHWSLFGKSRLFIWLKPILAEVRLRNYKEMENTIPSKTNRLQ
jgi:hypothetical protein